MRYEISKFIYESYHYLFNFNSYYDEIMILHDDQVKYNFYNKIKGYWSNSKSYLYDSMNELRVSYEHIWYIKGHIILQNNIRTTNHWVITKIDLIKVMLDIHQNTKRIWHAHVCCIQRQKRNNNTQNIQYLWILQIYNNMNHDTTWKMDMIVLTPFKFCAVSTLLVLIQFYYIYAMVYIWMIFYVALLGRPLGQML